MSIERHCGPEPRCFVLSAGVGALVCRLKVAAGNEMVSVCKPGQRGTCHRADSRVSCVRNSFSTAPGGAL